MSELESIFGEIMAKATSNDRVLVGIAGPPGAGKSTVAQDLMDRFKTDEAVVVPMDGFHYDNRVLDQMGLRGRKGAPETFDFAGFREMLQRLRRREANVAIPLFDRDADLARAGACLVGSSVKVVLVEGNYLLLNRPPWSELAELFDVKAFLDVPREELRRRLMQRWLDLGYSAERAEHWVESNDMLNVDLVMGCRH